MKSNRIIKDIENFSKWYANCDFSTPIKDMAAGIQTGEFLCVEITHDNNVVGWLVFRVEDLGEGSRYLVVMHAISTYKEHSIVQYSPIIGLEYAKQCNCDFIRVHASNKSLQKSILAVDGFEEMERVYIKAVK